MELLLPFGQESFISQFSKYIEIKIYGLIVLPVFLYGCETWSFTLKIEQRRRICKKMFGSKSGGLNCVFTGVMMYTSHQILL
jgi:hypothetical protein